MMKQEEQQSYATQTRATHVVTGEDVHDKNTTRGTKSDLSCEINHLSSQRLSISHTQLCV